MLKAVDKQKWRLSSLVKLFINAIYLLFFFFFIYFFWAACVVTSHPPVTTATRHYSFSPSQIWAAGDDWHEEAHWLKTNKRKKGKKIGLMDYYEFDYLYVMLRS